MFGLSKKVIIGIVAAIIILPLGLVPLHSVYYENCDAEAYSYAKNIGDVNWSKESPIKNSATEAIDAFISTSSKYEELKTALYYKAINNEKRDIVPFNYLFIPNILINEINQKENILKKMTDSAIDTSGKLLSIDEYAKKLKTFEPFKTKLSYLSTKTIEGYIFSFKHISTTAPRLSKQQMIIAKNNYIYPFEKMQPITATIGWYTPFDKPLKHNGTDFGASCSTPIYCVYEGVIIDASTGYTDDTLGNFIIIKTKDNMIMKYYHLSNIVYFKKGDYLKTGELVGLVGSSGFSSGCHLHLGYETLKGDILPICDYLKCDYIRH